MADVKRVEDADLDNLDQPEVAKEEDAEKQKPAKKPRLKVDTTFLVDGSFGLKSLYKRMHNEKNFHLRGKGHEVTDFNKVMTQLRGWHFESMAKLEVSHFADRVATVGQDKAVKAFMSRLRLVHKGLEVLDEGDIPQ